MTSLIKQLCAIALVQILVGGNVIREDVGVTVEVPNSMVTIRSNPFVEHPAISANLRKYNTYIIPDINSRKKIARVLGAPKARPVKSFRGSSAQDKLQYHSGSVFAAPAIVYCIWYGDWSGALGESSSPAAKSIMTDFISNLGGSSWLGTVSQYSQIPNGVTYGGSIDVTYLTNTTGAIKKVMTILDKDQIITDAVIKMNASATDNDIYMLIVSEDVTENEGFCVNYCAYHSSVTTSQRTIQTSFIGNSAQCLSACAHFSSGTINGIAAADAMVNHIAHEISEVITDACDNTGAYNGWYDINSEEIADKCSFDFGAETYCNGTANIHLGSRDYLVQQLWNNNEGGMGHCTMGL